MDFTRERWLTLHHWRTFAALGALALVSLGIFLLVEKDSRFICVPTPPTEIDKYQKTISALDSVADIGIKLSTTLVGVAAAVLLGFKAGFRLTSAVQTLILISALCFLQSALYAVMWRIKIAELWLNNCLDLIINPLLQNRYQAHFYFFLAGLICMGVLVLVAALAPQSAQSGS